MTCRVANVLNDHDIAKGDVVTIYMPAMPLTVACMLACARIGAIHRCVGILTQLCRHNEYGSLQRTHLDGMISTKVVHLHKANSPLPLKYCYTTIIHPPLFLQSDF